MAAERRSRLSPEAGEQRKVFEQAYEVALQVIELREKHGLTQAQLAERCGVDQGDIVDVFDGYGVLTDDGIARLRDGELSMD